MRCFSVLALLAACISAAQCMSYGMGSGMASGMASGMSSGMASGGYGMAAGGMATGASAFEGTASQYAGSASEFAQTQSTEASSFEASSFNSAAASQYAGGAAGYGSSSYGGYGAGVYDATSAGYGAAAGGYGAAAAGGYGYAQGAVSQAAGATGYQAGNFQSTKISKSASSSSMSAASATSAAAVSSSAYSASLSYYPNLSNIPFFSTCFNALSADEMSYGSLWSSNFNVQSTLTSMFSSNSLFKSYFCGATGIDFSRYSATDLTRVYSAFSSNKSAFVGLVRNFARRGYIYNTSFASTLLQYSSVEFFSSASKFAAYSNVQSWSQLGLSRFFANSYYRTQIASFCGVSSWDEAVVTRQLSNYFRTNAVGTSLFFRHLLLNRVGSSCSYSQYSSLSSSSYMSARNQYFNYYGGFYNSIQQSSSSFARSSSFQSASSVASSSSYSSAMSASSTKTFSSVSQYYGSTFASSSLFKSCFALESFDTSSESRFYGSAFSSGFDFASAYGPVLQDQLFRRYMFGCVGGFYDVSSQMTSQLFTYAQQYPGFFARTTKLYARNGAFFTSSLGRLFIEQDSAFFFSSQVSTYRSSLLSVQSWNQCGLGYLFQSRYYQRKLATFFGLSTFDYSTVSSAMINLFQRNYAGGLLALRHLVYRKYIGQSFSASSYMSISSAQSYSSMLAYRCPFYSSWSSYYRQYSQRSSMSRASSFSRTAATQSTASSSSFGAAASGVSQGYSAGGMSSAGYGGVGGYY